MELHKIRHKHCAHKPERARSKEEGGLPRCAPISWQSGQEFDPRFDSATVAAAGERVAGREALKRQSSERCVNLTFFDETFAYAGA